MLGDSVGMARHSQLGETEIGGQRRDGEEVESGKENRERGGQWSVTERESMLVVWLVRGGVENRKNPLINLHM